MPGLGPRQRTKENRPRRSSFRLDAHLGALRLATTSDLQGRHGVSHRHVRDGEYADELAWYRATIGKEPSIVPLPASARYRGDYRWQPVEPAGGRPVWLR